MTTPMSSSPVASTEAATGTDAEESCRNPNPATAPVAPAVCFLRFAGDSMAGAFMGSIFGYGKGLFNKKGFKGSFGEAGSSAKTFAVFSGVHSLVSCLMKRMRGKDDAVNAGVAGCCTGVALSFPGAPQILLQNCLMFGAFSYVMEGLNKQQPALANSSPGGNSIINLPSPNVLPPFSLPLPSNIMEDFSSFCKALTKKPKDATAW